ncbi:MAG TPA: hypothetical protein VF418_03260 [Sphingomonadaceae bacterium]
MSLQSLTENTETMELYDRSVKCWIDLTVASNLGPALGVEAPQHTREATEAWRQAAIEIGALLGKDEAAVKADAGNYYDPIFAASQEAGSNLSEVLGPVMQRAAQCEAQFTGKH